jgi:hypothetical protein
MHAATDEAKMQGRLMRRRLCFTGRSARDLGATSARQARRPGRGLLAGANLAIRGRFAIACHDHGSFPRGANALDRPRVFNEVRPGCPDGNLAMFIRTIRNR